MRHPSRLSPIGTILLYAKLLQGFLDSRFVEADAPKNNLPLTVDHVVCGVSLNAVVVEDSVTLRRIADLERKLILAYVLVDRSLVVAIVDRDQVETLVFELAVELLQVR